MSRLWCCLTSKDGTCHNSWRFCVLSTLNLQVINFLCLSLCKEHLSSPVCCCMLNTLTAPSTFKKCVSEISFSNLSKIYSTVNCSICTSNETASIPDFSSTNIEISIAGLILIIILILYYLIIWFFNRAYSMQAKIDHSWSDYIWDWLDILRGIE